VIPTGLERRRSLLAVVLIVDCVRHRSGGSWPRAWARDLPGQRPAVATKDCYSAASA
jgi:hypothetical protein